MVIYNVVLFFRTETLEQSETPGTPLSTTNTPNESKVRSELINALSSNHEKRREIASLRDQINKLQHELETSEHLLKESKKTMNSANPHIAAPPDNDACPNCVELQELQRHQQEEFVNLKEALDESKENNRELQANMVDMVKTLDKKKIQDAEAHNNAMLKFVDDAKESLRKELESVHQGEIEVPPTLNILLNNFT